MNDPIAQARKHKLYWFWALKADIKIKLAVFFYRLAEKLSK